MGFNFEDIVKNTLNENISSICFHFTGLDNFVKIIKSDRFILKTNAVSKSEHWNQPKRRFFMSVTRASNPYIGYNSWVSNGFVRLTLDGDLLSNNYRGKPVNFFRWPDKYNTIDGDDSDYNYIDLKDRDKREFSTKQSALNGINNIWKDKSVTNLHNLQGSNQLKYQAQIENEDRIFSDKPFINGAKKYIKRIDILIAKSAKDRGSYKKVILRELNNIKDYFTEHHDIFHFYGTMEDFASNRNEIQILPSDLININQTNQYDFSKEVTSCICNVALFMGLYYVMMDDNAPFAFKVDAINIAEEYLDDYGLSNYSTPMVQMASELYSDELGGEELNILSSKAQEGIKKLNCDYAESDDALNCVKMLTDFVREMGGDSIFFHNGIMQKLKGK